MIIEVNLGYHSKKLYPLINDQYTVRLDEAFRYSEMIWKIWKISVLVIITPKETSSAAAAALLPDATTALLRRRRRPPPFIHVYTFFFRIEKNDPEIVFFTRDYASRNQIYHLTFRNITVRTQTPLEYYTTYIYIHTLYENKRGR